MWWRKLFLGLTAGLAALMVVVASGAVVCEQVNAGGFGGVPTSAVGAVEAFESALYAGTSNVSEGARIYRTFDGPTWAPVTDPGFGIPHDTAPVAIMDMTTFGGRLYASTGLGDGPGQIWRTINGVNWAPVVVAGFADADTVDIGALAAYDGQLYAGAKNLVLGAQVWRSYTGDSNSWEKVAQDAGESGEGGVTAMAVFDGALYAAVEGQGPAQVWRTYGGAWEVVVGDGFGDTETTRVGCMAEFGGYLYAGAGNLGSGAQIWRTMDGEQWAPAAEPGFGDGNNEAVQTLSRFQQSLYAGVNNATTGLELWRTQDGANWEQVNADGFEDAGNAAMGGSHAISPFLGSLYAGTQNGVSGGQLWAMSPDTFYDVAVSADEARSGLPGTVVTYTASITNTGNTTDTFSLLLAGNTWDTALSAASITLGSGASEQMGVTVSIPAGALAEEGDVVTLTATSGGDPARSDALQLTTIAQARYGVVAGPAQAQVGAPGGALTYTLTITNSGNVTDTFDLSLAGNAWESVLSAVTLTVAPGNGETFGLGVQIPVSATAGTHDVVVVTATSRGDAAIHAGIPVTTSCAATEGSIYLPFFAGRFLQGVSRPAS